MTTLTPGGEATVLLRDTGADIATSLKPFHVESLKRYTDNPPASQWELVGVYPNRMAALRAMQDMCKEDKRMKVCNTHQIIYLAVEQITPAPWNPARRTTSNALQGLIASMRESGFWWYMPLILARDGTLADGHRRLAAAKALRLTEVPCVRADKAADVLWAEINGRRRTVSTADSLEAATNGLTVLPDEHARSVSEIVRIVGMDNLKQPFMVGVAPGILSYGKQVARYVGLEGDEDMIRRTVLWLRKHEMQRRVRSAMEAEVNHELLLGYILNDAPLPPLRLALIGEDAQA